MADRLQELLQQRALIKEHLAWLEGEISAASGRPVEMREPAPAPFPAAQPAVAGPIPMPAPGSLPGSLPRREGNTVRMRDDADTMIARMAAEENPAPVPTKKGCWIFFCATLVLLGAAAWVALHYFYRE